MATANLETLIKLSDLKTNIVQDLMANSVVFLHYDDLFDAFTLMMVPPDTDTIVHYIDDNVGLLYEPKSKEIVGFQIEAFHVRRDTMKNFAVIRLDKVQKTYTVG